MTKSHPENSEGKPHISQIPPLTHPSSQIYLQEDPHQLQNENEIMARTSLTIPEEDHFNKSLITLLNGQQDFQKQSLNMMQGITHRYVYDNLMRDITYMMEKMWN